MDECGSFENLLLFFHGHKERPSRSVIRSQCRNSDGTGSLDFALVNIDYWATVCSSKCSNDGCSGLNLISVSHQLPTTES